MGLEAAPRCVGRHRAGGVARRGHRQPGQSQLLCLRDRRRQAAGLERGRRVEPLVLDEQPLDPQLASQAVGLEEGREALAETDDVLLLPHRHHLEVPPHVGPPAFEGFPRKAPSGGGEVVPGIEHLSAIGAGPVGLVRREARAAPGAFEVVEVATHFSYIRRGRILPKSVTFVLICTHSVAGRWLWMEHSR